MAMFRVYLDDSGNQEGRGVFAVAGYIGEAGQWDHFQRNWDEILAAFNEKHGLKIRYLHMTDLVSGRKDFKSVDKLTRSILLYKFCMLAKARTIAGIGSFVMMEDYIQVLGEPVNLPPAVPTPLVLCRVAGQRRD